MDDRHSNPPRAAPKVNSHAYLAARARVITRVGRLALAHGIALSVDIDPERAPFEVVADTHLIQLTYGRNTRVVTVDHDTFINEEFFRTLVLHQLETAIAELAASA